MTHQLIRLYRQIPTSLIVPVPTVISPSWWLTDSAVDLKFTTSQYYDGADGAVVTDLLSCSRASIGYAQTVAGALTQFATNTLRITDQGLLVEDARVNQQSYSQDFDSAGWTQALLTATDNSAVAPDGTTTAASLDDGTTGADRHRIYSNTSGVPATAPFVSSVYIKPGTLRYVLVYFAISGDLHGVYAVVDTVTKTISDSGSWGTEITSTSAALELLANDWMRLALMGTYGGTDACFFQINGSPSSTFNTGEAPTFSSLNYTGTNKTIIVWGAQVENSASFASSYIPTTSAAATRAADVVACSGSLDTVLTTIPLSAVVDLQTLTTSVPSGGGGNATLLAGSNANDWLLRWQSDTVVKSQCPSGITAPLGTGTFATGIKVGAAEDGSGFSLVGGGGTVTTDAGFEAPNTPITVGSDPFGDFGWAYFRRLTAWSSRLSDATLQGFTAP